MRLNHHPLAQSDVIEAAQYYNAKESMLAVEFLDAVDVAVEEIRESPERWAKVRGDVRSRSVRRFPYSLEYQVINGEIWILVVRQHSRNPDYGTDRGPAAL